MTKSKELSFHHLIRPAKPGIKKAQAIFMLHGYGSDEEDLFSFSSELPDDICIISVRAPHTLMPFGYAWYAIHFDTIDGKWSDDKQAVESRDNLAKFIDEAVEAYDLDPERITLLGFSQGTILGYAVTLSYPGKIQKIIGLSGYINKDIIKPGINKNDYSKLRIYASHGSLDQTIPVEWARKISPYLDDLQIDHIYEEFPVGHGVAPQNFYSFKNWFLKH